MQEALTSNAHMDKQMSLVDLVSGHRGVVGTSMNVAQPPCL